MEKNYIKELLLLIKIKIMLGDIIKYFHSISRFFNDIYDDIKLNGGNGRNLCR